MSNKLSKKRNKKKQENHVMNLKLICGTILFVLFILSAAFVFHYSDIDEGGGEVLENLKNP